jgi:hypothetical protein
MYRIAAIIFVLTLFAAVACKKTVISVTCNQNAKSISEEVGKSFVIKCPANCAMGIVWGTGTYTTDSSLCMSAIHAGVIKAEGGDVKVTIKAGLSESKGSDQNGVKSGAWGSYNTSFIVEK